MTKLFTALALVFATFTPLAQADVSGSIGMESEYFFRGASQGSDPALQMNLHLQNENGWFAGVWASQVDLMDAAWEHDFYGGYALSVTEDFGLIGGVIHYDYDEKWMKIGPDSSGGLDDITEGFVGVYYDNLELTYYVDVDNTDLDYLELGYQLPFISMIDLELNYGRFNDGENVVGMTASKDIGQWGFSLMIMEEARHGDFMDNASFGIHYNF